MMALSGPFVDLYTEEYGLVLPEGLMVSPEGLMV